MNSMNVDSIRANRTRAILAFSVPAIISMVLTSLINVADGFFMGNFIHKDAIAAVNLGLPIIYLFLATGLMEERMKKAAVLFSARRWQPARHRACF